MIIINTKHSASHHHPGCLISAVCLTVLAAAYLLTPIRSGENPDDSAAYAALDSSPQAVPSWKILSQEEQTDQESWSLILVNKWHPLPEQYQVELTELSNGESVDKRIYPALQEMFDDMRKDGIYPIVASGYRTEEEQRQMMDDKIAAFCAEGYTSEEAEAGAKNWVALPGTSEHQLGLAVDINADGIHSEGYEVYEWLNQNSWRYGFIHRYSEDKTDITGISNEPWHYRYVGTQAAEEITTRGLCLEEYLEQP